ncbi:MAG: FKBP-type peptidyl-prolyl cis-trans isomerase [Woeseiaceae bacterium]
MSYRNTIAAIILTTFTVGCGQKAEENVTTTEPAAADPAVIEEAVVTDTANVETIEITSGLTARVLRAGDGQVAEYGDNVVVHYTGWLFDETAENNRGAKFDSSVDRGEHFQFPLGAGRVIQGWDQGVAGMAIGELRELTIAPEMGYGDRGAGSVIPPGATLVFEVELFDLQSLSDAP